MARPGWRWYDDPRKVRLMEWLLTPPSERVPDSKYKLAAEFGVDVRTMRQWHDHPQFRADWERQSKEVVGSPERAQNVLETLYRAATDPTNKGHVQAAKLYLEATNAIKPPPIDLRVSRPSELTDEELDALLRSGAEQLAAERRQPGWDEEPEGLGKLLKLKPDGTSAAPD